MQELLLSCHNTAVKCSPVLSQLFSSNTKIDLDLEWVTTKAEQSAPCRHYIQCVLCMGAHVWVTHTMHSSCAHRTATKHTASRRAAHAERFHRHTQCCAAKHNPTGLAKFIRCLYAEELRVRCVQASAREGGSCHLNGVGIITSNTLWRDTKQRPTWIRDARNERFLPFPPLPSFPPGSIPFLHI